MAIALSPSVGNVVPVVMIRSTNLTATGSDITSKGKAPCKGRIVGVHASARAIGGSTAMSDVDLMVEKGTTDILASAIAVVDGAAVVAGGAYGSLTTTVANLAVEDGDVFTVDATVTGGSSPTCTDIVVTVLIARE